MNRTIPEPIRAWTTHTVRAARWAALIAAAAVLLLAFIWTAAWAIAGQSSLLTPILIVIGGVLLAGTWTWLVDRRKRPTSRPELLRGELVRPLRQWDEEKR